MLMEYFIVNVKMIIHFTLGSFGMTNIGCRRIPVITWVSEVRLLRFKS